MQKRLVGYSNDFNGNIEPLEKNDRAFGPSAIPDSLSGQLPEIVKMQMDTPFFNILAMKCRDNFKTACPGCIRDAVSGM